MNNFEALNQYTEAFGNPAKVFGSAEEMGKFMGAINQILYGINPYKEKTADELMCEYHQKISGKPCKHFREDHKCAYENCAGKGEVETEDDTYLCREHADYLQLKV